MRAWKREKRQDRENLEADPGIRCALLNTKPFGAWGAWEGRCKARGPGAAGKGQPLALFSIGKPQSEPELSQKPLKSVVHVWYWF